MGQALGGFQYQVERRLTVRILRRQGGIKSEHTLVEAAIEEGGVEMMETYIRRRQYTVTQYIDTQLSQELCKATERKQGAQVGIWWWTQAGIDLEGAMETAAMAADADEYGMI